MLQTKIYKAGLQRKGFLRLLKEMFSDLLSSRDLAWRLAVRDIKGMYRQSLLGLFWAFFTPLMNTLIWVFLDKSGVVKFSSPDIPYPVYVFTGTMLWSILIESINSPLLQAQAAQSIISKINIPKEALILSGIYKVVFNSGIKLLLVMAAIVLMGVFPDWTIALFPLALCSLILFGLSIGLVLTPVGLLYTDVGRALPMLMQFLMYFSPVVYVVPKTGRIGPIIEMNPITPIIEIARNLLTGYPSDHILYYLLINVVLLVILFLGWILFRVSIPVIVERLS
jgi:lipopolysaccharide transport system permease protein